MLVFAMPKAKLNPNWLFIAVRSGQETVEIPAGMIEMRVVACDECEAKYTIRHSRPFLKPEQALKQAEELNSRLLEHHRAGIEHIDVYCIV